MTQDKRAEKIVAVVSELLQRTEPANEVKPVWRRIEAEATARGFPSTRAFRAWCFARGVTVRELSQRDTWVCPAEVDRAVEAMPAATPPKPRRAPTRDELDDDVDAMR